MQFASALRTTMFFFVAGALSAASLTQCPAGVIEGVPYTGCNFSFFANADGSLTTKTDSSQPYIGGEDNYAGFQNDTAKTVYSIAVDGHGVALFSFDQDGPNPGNMQPACSGNAAQSAAGSGSLTGYEGPGVTFSNISADCMKGTVNFVNGVAPGQSAYFFLENALDPNLPLPSALVMPAGPASAAPEPDSWMMFGAGLLLVAVRKLR